MIQIKLFYDQFECNEWLAEKNSFDIRDIKFSSSGIMVIYSTKEGNE